MKIKTSSSLEGTLKKVIGDMLRMNLVEKDVPEVPSFRLSKTKKVPDGYKFIKEISEENVTFFLFQKI